jgi:ferric-dicitrate binding protein FerR (iron transport regulator)
LENKPDINDIDELLAKYFSGEATADEALHIHEWKNATDGNQKYYNQVAMIFNHKQPVTDVSKNYKIIQAQIKQSVVHKVIPIWYKVAATITFFIFTTLAVLWFVKYNTSIPSQTITAENVKSVFLPDSLFVTLNKSASITYDDSYNKTNRKIILIGEAFFDVDTKSKIPLVINAGGLQITDIGTSFNVKANQANDTVEVFVVEGIVELYNDKERMRVYKNEVAYYIKSTKHLFKTGNYSKNAIAYKTHTFDFRNASLADVVATINQVYGNVIVLANSKLNDCLINVEFKDESPETIVMVLAETLGLSYTKKEAYFELNGKACNE